MKMVVTAFLLACAALSYAQNTSCEKLLVPYNAYQQKEDEKWNLEIKKDQHYTLYYFGAAHSKDTSLPQFTQIEKAWNSVKPDIALFEGPDRGVLPTAGETILKLGESGFVRFLANRDSIPVQTLEPGPDVEIRYLATIFPVDQIKLFYALREAQRVREQNKMNKEQIYQHISQMLVKANQLPLLQDTLTTIADIQSAFIHYWGKKIEWWQAPAAWFSPLKNRSETGGQFTNAINQKSSEFRNRYMYQLISGLLKEGKTVFAVVGRNHVPMQTKAIECAWQQYLQQKNSTR